MKQKHRVLKLRTRFFYYYGIAKLLHKHKAWCWFHIMLDWVEQSFQQVRLHHTLTIWLASRRPFWCSELKSYLAKQPTLLAKYDATLPHISSHPPRLDDWEGGGGGMLVHVLQPTPKMDKLRDGYLSWLERYKQPILCYIWKENLFFCCFFLLFVLLRFIGVKNLSLWIRVSSKQSELSHSKMSLVTPLRTKGGRTLFGAPQFKTM